MQEENVLYQKKGYFIEWNNDFKDARKKDLWKKRKTIKKAF